MDIVERLRNDDVVWGVRPSLAFEAADEIERLRGELDTKILAIGGLVHAYVNDWKVGDAMVRARQVMADGYSPWVEIEKLQALSLKNGKRINDLEKENKELREDLDLVKQIGRIEIDAKLRYAAALRMIANNEVAEHADVDMIRDFANEALKWRE
jgi:hypothetical protein